MTGPTITVSILSKASTLRHMRARNTVLGLALVLGGCGGSTAEEIITCQTIGTCTMTLLSGADQTGAVSIRLAEPFAVQITHASGEVPPPVTIDWEAVSGGGTITPTETVTDEMLTASAQATLSQTAGVHVFRAVLREDPAVTLEFTATAAPGPARMLEIVSGQMQTAEVGTELAMPLVVRATDTFGNPVEDQPVGWRVTAGDGVVQGQEVQTDANGEVQAIATVGEAAGENTNIFLAESPLIQGARAQFFATGVPGPARALGLVSGNNQAGVRTEPLSAPLVVAVSDRFMNPVQGATVTFTSLTEGGAVTPDSAITDEFGEAEAAASLGDAPGSYRFRAELPGAGSVDFSATAFPPLCSTDDWCWTAPVPQGNTLNDSFSVSPTDVWVVGDYGAILRWNGIAWEGLRSNVTADLHGVFGTASDNVWAVGDGGTVLRYDGDQWRVQDIATTRDLRDIWGVGTDFLIAVGDAGTIFTYNGIAWTAVQTPTDVLLNGVWGLSADALFVAGDNGIALLYDGASWRIESAPDLDDLNGVWGTSPTNVWFVGDRDSFLRWNGVVFETFPSSGNVALRGVWGASEDEVYAVGDRGRLRRFTNGNWRAEISRTPNDLASVTGSSSGFIAVGEGGVVIRRPDREWRLESSRALKTLQAVWGTATDALWAVGDTGTVLSYDGGAWSEADIGINTSNIIGLHGAGRDDVWAVGANSQTFHYTGEANGWTTVRAPTPETLNAVHVFSSTLAYAVGDAGVLVQWDGSRWNLGPALGDGRLNGVWGANPNDVWIVGDNGRAYRFDGASWTEQAGFTTASLLGVRGRTASEVYAWGSGGALLRFDGATWTPIITGTNRVLFGLHFAGPTDTWLVGEGGTVLRNQGGGWVPQQSGTRNFLFGVFGASPQDVWIVGETGTILRRNPDSMTGN